MKPSLLRAGRRYTPRRPRTWIAARARHYRASCCRRRFGHRHRAIPGSGRMAVLRACPPCLRLRAHSGGGSNRRPVFQPCLSVRSKGRALRAFWADRRFYGQRPLIRQSQQIRLCAVLAVWHEIAISVFKSAFDKRNPSDGLVAGGGLSSFGVEVSMRLAISVAAATLALSFAACNVAGIAGRTGGFSLATTVDEASIQRGRAAFASSVAAGYRYNIRGRVSNLNVSSLHGRTSVVGDAGPGDYIDITLLKSSSNVFTLSPTRTQFFFNPGCADDCSNGGVSSPTPNPQPTNPPNYNSCAAIGGATWFNQQSGDGDASDPVARSVYPVERGRTLRLVTAACRRTMARSMWPAGHSYQ